VCDINGTESAIKTTRRNQIRIYLHIFLLLEWFLVNKDFFYHPYYSYLALSVYPSSSSLGSLGSLTELAKKESKERIRGGFLADPEEVYDCQTYYAIKDLWN